MASRSRPPPGLTRGCGFLLPPAPASRRLPLLRARAPHCLPEALLAPGPPYPPHPPCEAHFRATCAPFEHFPG